MVAPILDGEADAVFGSRMMITRAARKGGMPLYKYVGNRSSRTFENAVLGHRPQRVPLGLSRLHVSSARGSSRFEHNTDDFDFDTEIIIQLDRRRHAASSRSRSRRTTATRSATSTA